MSFDPLKKGQVNPINPPASTATVPAPTQQKAPETSTENTSKASTTTTYKPEDVLKFLGAKSTPQGDAVLKSFNAETDAALEKYLEALIPVVSIDQRAEAFFKDRERFVVKFLDAGLTIGAAYSELKKVCKVFPISPKKFSELVAILAKKHEGGLSEATRTRLKKRTNSAKKAAAKRDEKPVADPKNAKKADAPVAASVPAAPASTPPATKKEEPPKSPAAAKTPATDTKK